MNQKHTFYRRKSTTKIVKVSLSDNNYSFRIVYHSTPLPPLLPSPLHSSRWLPLLSWGGGSVSQSGPDPCGRAWLEKLRASYGVQRVSPMMGDTPCGVVALRTCPSSVASLRGKGDPRPRGLASPYRAIRRSLLHLSRAAPRSPKVGSRMVLGWGGAERAVGAAALGQGFWTCLCSWWCQIRWRFHSCSSWGPCSSSTRSLTSLSLQPIPRSWC